MVIPGGGLNSTVAGLANHPFNPMEEFKGEYRVIAADLRNANGGQSSGPLEIDRPWDAYTDDHIGLMDHLGIREFMVLGFCIGGPFIWNLMKRAPDRIVAGVLAQPTGFRPDDARPLLPEQHQGLGPAAVRAPPRHHDGPGRRVPEQDVPQQRRLCVHRDARFRKSCQTPILILPDDVPAHPYAVAMESAHLAPNAQVSIYPWKATRNRSSSRCATSARSSRRIGLYRAHQPMAAAAQ